VRAILAGLKGRDAAGEGAPRRRRIRRRVADGDDRVGRATDRMETRPQAWRFHASAMGQNPILASGVNNIMPRDKERNPGWPWNRIVAGTSRAAASKVQTAR
jgi:hypothetical protein